MMTENNKTTRFGFTPIIICTQDGIEYREFDKLIESNED